MESIVLEKGFDIGFPFEVEKEAEAATKDGRDFSEEIKKGETSETLPPSPLTPWMPKILTTLFR